MDWPPCMWRFPDSIPYHEKLSITLFYRPARILTLDLRMTIRYLRILNINNPHSEAGTYDSKSNIFAKIYTIIFAQTAVSRNLLTELFVTAG